MIPGKDINLSLRLLVEPTRPPIQYEYVLETKGTEDNSDHLSVRSAEIKNAWRFPSLPYLRLHV